MRHQHGKQQIVTIIQARLFFQLFQLFFQLFQVINFFPNLYRLTCPETPVPPEVVRVLVAEVLVAAAAPLPLTHPVPPGDRATLPGVNPISHWAPTATMDLKALVFPALAIAATAILCS